MDERSRAHVHVARLSDSPETRFAVIYTIGHSTHTTEAFLALLEAHRIEHLADVRSFPSSRRHPHFNKEALDAQLSRAGISYRHFPELGGFRRPLPDSVNTGLRHPAFRGYADYMQTEAFSQGIVALLAFAAGRQTTVMCAEAVWWQCHRRLLADALIVRHVPVRHILPSGALKPHELSEFAARAEVGVIYPGLL
jgi:uncharacterized protein (DUF488 family)